MVAWVRAEGEVGAVVAARYTPERGWARPVVVHGRDLLYVFDLEIVADPRAGVLATWVQTDGSRNNVWYALFDPDTQWRRAHPVDGTNAGWPVFNPSTGEPVTFGVSIVERCLYQARHESRDPLGALRKTRRNDAGAPGLNERL